MINITVYYNKSSNSYTVNNFGNKNYKTYGIGVFGDKYAKELAYLTDKTGEKFKNYYIKKKDYYILRIFSKVYGYNDVYIDLDSYELIKHIRWSLSKDGNTFYCRGKYKLGNRHINVKLHRYVMQYIGDLHVDHINGNGLDNRKKNLRLVDRSSNSKNQKNRINKSKNKVYINVYNRNNKRFVAFWTDNNSKQCSSSFSIEKYGYYEALNIAILTSINSRLRYGYLLTDADYYYLNNPRSILHLRHNESNKKHKPRTILHLRKKK